MRCRFGFRGTAHPQRPIVGIEGHAGAVEGCSLRGRDEGASSLCCAQIIHTGFGWKKTVKFTKLACFRRGSLKP